MALFVDLFATTLADNLLLPKSQIGAMITISWKTSSIQKSTFSCFLNGAKRNW
jgi:hypothetical protein